MRLAVLNGPLAGFFWFLVLPLRLLEKLRVSPNEPVVTFSPSYGHIVNVVADGTHRKLRRCTIERDLCRFPDLELGTMSEATSVLERRYITLPKVITQERFLDALDVLPPVAYTERAGNVTFKLSEKIYGSVTTIFARVDGTYYEFDDRISLPHNTIVSWCMLYAPVAR